MARGRSRLTIWLRRTRVRLTRATDPVLGPIRAKWGRSRMVRTMAVTGVITGVMILLAGLFILTSVSDDLYGSRKDQALRDSARATLAAQRQIDASDASDRSGLSALSASVRRTVQDASASQMVYLRRQPGQALATEAPPASTTDLKLPSAVSDELAEAVASGDEPQYVQPTSFVSDDGERAPGLVVASTLSFPDGAGTYDLFIGYDLSDTESTLAFVERTLAITAIFLMLFVGVLVWTMSRIAFRPVRVAADTSRRLAAGESDARMPPQNDEHFDMLSQGFNDMADTLQARIDELDLLSEMQQRFVSDVSHELRTPLTTIRLASEVLQGQKDTLAPAQQRAVEVLGSQLERFESLLADLLEISRYDAGHVTLETERTSLVALAQAEIEVLQPLSAGVIELRPLGGHVQIEVDKRRIRRIISNLIGNAIEHGEGKAIVVSIDSNASSIALSVRDWGVGMGEDAAYHVFDRFWRADPSRKRTLGGTGLGLAIAQEDAAVHGGVIEVWSEPGEGANFRLTLPRGDTVTSFMSPLPLIPDDAPGQVDELEATGGWLRSPKRWVRRERGR